MAYDLGEGGVFLHKGSWREFKIFLLLKGYAREWDKNISQKIFMILHGEEIRERFLSAFPPLNRFEKLDLSLDDIINPIEILEEKSHKKGCHPGRLTLDPEAYHRAFTGGKSSFNDAKQDARDRELEDDYSHESNTICPGFMRSGYLNTPWGKHRLLAKNENPNPYQKALGQHDPRSLWGLQDLYFIGGLPLMYWCRGDSMGMSVFHGPPDSVYYQWTSTVFRPTQEIDQDMGRVGPCGKTYCFSRMWYIPTELTWRKNRNWGGRWIPVDERRPRTWFGNEEWVRRRPGINESVGWGKDKFNNAYIEDIQRTEDFNEAAKTEGLRIHRMKFDEYCRWVSLYSDTPQPITIGGYEIGH